MIAVAIGCPSGVGPEVCVAAAARVSMPRVLVGDEQTVLDAADVVGVPRSRFLRFEGTVSSGSRIYVHQVGPPLARSERKPGRPSRAGGAAQLVWIEAAYDLARVGPHTALVTGPVSKRAIARSGRRGAAKFRGHTEWLRERDGASAAVMCFSSKKLTTSLVTTHLPLGTVPRRIRADSVRNATVWLARLLLALGKRDPRIAVSALNPHAGESGLFGREESQAILPGIVRARRTLRGRVAVQGPIGAETAYRRAVAGDFDGVVAMYHDQATIPTKLLAFGDTVNVTMGLSIVRTSVDHGTAYDIAWRGEADWRGMRAAMRLGERLARTRFRT